MPKQVVPSTDKSCQEDFSKVGKIWQNSVKKAMLGQIGFNTDKIISKFIPN